MRQRSEQARRLCRTPFTAPRLIAVLDRTQLVARESILSENAQDERAFALGIAIGLAGELLRQPKLQCGIRRNVSGMTAQVIKEYKVIPKRGAALSAHIRW